MKLRKGKPQNPQGFVALLPYLTFRVEKLIAGMPKSLNTIGSHIKYKRLKGNTSQRFVASLFDTDIRTINNWERNKIKTIAAKYYPKIMVYLNYCPLVEDAEFGDAKTFGQRIKLHRLYLGLNQR